MPMYAKVGKSLENYGGKNYESSGGNKYLYYTCREFWIFLDPAKNEGAHLNDSLPKTNSNAYIIDKSIERI